MYGSVIHYGLGIAYSTEDERLVRRYALRRSLSVIGTVRVLTLAEERGLIESAAHCIETMAGNGHRISRYLLEVIRCGGEGKR